jgi:hypothetical protein
VTVHAIPSDATSRGQAVADRIRAEGFEQGKQERFAEVTATHVSEIGRIGQAHSTEMAKAEHRAEAHGFWRGSALALLVGLAIGGMGAYSAVQSGMFGLVAADRARHDRWSPPLGPIDSGVVDQPAGYDHNPSNGRPLHEPADAP